MKSTLKLSEIIMILAGSIILAFGITWFLSPPGLVTGGLTGIAIIVEKISFGLFENGVPIWLTNAILNIPLFAVSIKQRGFAFAKKSLYAVIFLSISLWGCEILSNPFAHIDDLLLSSLFGGVLVGIGVGLVIRAGATTGGTDMLAAIFKFIKPDLPIQKVMLLIDAIIIVGGMFVFGIINTMYAIISVIVTTKMVTLVLEGGSSAKAAFIVSERSDEIAESIMNTVGRGTTALKARGMYSKLEKEMIFVVLSQKELPLLRQVIMEIDPNAFITIAEVREVLGEGFVEEYDPMKL
ncbi:YitT family protein [Proteocatella sphenisci]|uniref:YitT family protein n=1 Tax=Proteocatella sphenisci TaxID=181070 RepID=UPI0004BB1905|nr:YitT family protein [Proteocatella sphenisci]